MQTARHAGAAHAANVRRRIKTLDAIELQNCSHVATVMSSSSLSSGKSGREAMSINVASLNLWLFFPPKARGHS